MKKQYSLIQSDVDVTKTKIKNNLKKENDSLLLSFFVINSFLI